MKLLISANRALKKIYKETDAWSKLPKPIIGVLKLFRLNKLATKLFGIYHHTNHGYIEIDITYYCNLKCFNCDRLCNQMPTDEHISVEQIRKFIKESKAMNRKWQRITILGGEPTLHPQIIDIVKLLIEYKREFSPATKIALVSNGNGPKVKEALFKISKHKDIKIKNTKKISKENKFCSINIAPIDNAFYKAVDYSNGCWVTELCGISLTPFGYYPCATSGAIDRAFGFDIGRKKLPSSRDSMTYELNMLCKYCGRFKFVYMLIKKEKMSPVWKKACEAYKKKKPRLTRY